MPPFASSWTMPLGNISMLGVLGALGLWLGFPNALYHLPILVLLYPISLYIIGKNCISKMDALRKGWIVGTLGASAALYWVSIPVQNVGKLPWFLAMPCIIVMGAYVGLFGGVFTLLSYILKKQFPLSTIARCIALACAWYVLEFLRAIVLTGFPWLQLSAAFVPWPSMIQAASLIGTYGLSAIYVCAILFITETIIDQKSRIRLGLIGISLLLAPILFGNYILFKNPLVNNVEEHNATFILVEGNIDQNIKWEESSQAASLNTYINLSKKAVSEFDNNTIKAQTVLIWPETAMPFYLERHRKFATELIKFVKEVELPLIVGAPAIQIKGNNDREIFNRAYLINPEGQLAGFYDKMHLVPFGEYVPPWLLINFLESLLQGIGNFTPGTKIKPLIYKELALGMLICYESIFTDIARERVRQGANILVNISNDAWFGDSAAPAQHLQLSMMRAVEQGRYLVRGTNTGISAIVDDFGRPVLKGGQFKAQTLTGHATTKHEYTIYYHLSPWLIYIVLSLFVITLFWGRVKTK